MYGYAIGNHSVFPWINLLSARFNTWVRILCGYSIDVNERQSTSQGVYPSLRNLTYLLDVSLLGVILAHALLLLPGSRGISTSEIFWF